MFAEVPQAGERQVERLFAEDAVEFTHVGFDT